MNSSPLTISLNSFYYWLEDPALCQILSWLIPRYAKKVDGFELSVTFAELEPWIEELKIRAALPPQYTKLESKAQETIRSCHHNSIHLEDIKCLPLGKEKWFAQCLNELSLKTGITAFTTHPDEVSTLRWHAILEDLSPSVQLSIENMCFRKNSHTDLKTLSVILEKYRNIFMTFDISHWTETGRSLHDLELQLFINKFGSRINKIHCSAPESSVKEYRFTPETSHHVCIDSNLTQAELLQSGLFHLPKAAVVLEGLIPTHDMQILDKEIDLVRSLISTLSDERKAA